MSTLSRSIKSTQGQDLASVKGHLQQQAILLRTSAAEQLARIKASVAKENVENIVASDIRNLRAQGKNDEADALMNEFTAQKFMAQNVGRDVASSKRTAAIGPDGTVDVQPQPVPAAAKPLGRSAAVGKAGAKSSGSSSSTTLHSYGDLEKMYPGRTREELKAAYVKKFGKEPKQ
jgi:hypothetical protein